MILRVISLALLALTVLLVGSPSALAQIRASEARRPLIFVPGFLGSRLCRLDPADPGKPQVVWGTLGALSQFPTLLVSGSEPAGGDGIQPCGLVREIVYFGLFTQEVYGPVITHLSRLGYREEHDLFVFDYDWRRSVFHNAERLAAFVREKVPDPSQRVDILAHSMGGLVSRVYATELGGERRIGKLISAGTPFLGSVKVFQTLENGWGTVNFLLGGLTAFRRTALSFASVFELMPRYTVCCDDGRAGVPPFVAADMEAWRSLHWDGIEPDSMADLTAAFDRIRDLQKIVDSALPPDIEDVLIIGVDQRTPQQVAFERSRGRTAVRVRTSWAGDGTVVRESAILPGRTVHPTSFADHEHILHDPQVQQFIELALTRSVAEAVRSVKVRPRPSVRTADGSLTELVGVAVATDQPLYRAGEEGEARVHIRLGSQRALSLEAIRLDFRTPDGRLKRISVRRATSDPTNPFEQTFVGLFELGSQSGIGKLTASLRVANARSRVIERPVPVVTP
jgi:pimeloyl-ACP methyl ester carboxylesterase